MESGHIHNYREISHICLNANCMENSVFSCSECPELNQCQDPEDLGYQAHCGHSQFMVNISNLVDFTAGISEKKEDHDQSLSSSETKENLDAIVLDSYEQEIYENVLSFNKDENLKNLILNEIFNGCTISGEYKNCRKAVVQIARKVSQIFQVLSEIDQDFSEVEEGKIRGILKQEFRCCVMPAASSENNTEIKIEFQQENFIKNNNNKDEDILNDIVENKFAEEPEITKKAKLNSGKKQETKKQNTNKRQSKKKQQQQSDQQQNQNQPQAQQQQQVKKRRKNTKQQEKKQQMMENTINKNILDDQFCSELENNNNNMNNNNMNMNIKQNDHMIDQYNNNNNVSNNNNQQQNLNLQEGKQSIQLYQSEQGDGEFLDNFQTDMFKDFYNNKDVDNPLQTPNQMNIITNNMQNLEETGEEFSQLNLLESPHNNNNQQNLNNSDQNNQYNQYIDDNYENYVNNNNNQENLNNNNDDYINVDNEVDAAIEDVFKGRVLSTKKNNIQNHENEDNIILENNDVGENPADLYYNSDDHSKKNKCINNNDIDNMIQNDNDNNNTNKNMQEDEEYMEIFEQDENNVKNEDDNNMNLNEDSLFLVKKEEDELNLEQDQQIQQQQDQQQQQPQQQKKKKGASSRAKGKNNLNTQNMPDEEEQMKFDISPEASYQIEQALSQLPKKRQVKRVTNILINDYEKKAYEHIFEVLKNCIQKIPDLITTALHYLKNAVNASNYSKEEFCQLISVLVHQYYISNVDNPKVTIQTFAALRNYIKRVVLSKLVIPKKATQEVKAKRWSQEEIDILMQYLDQQVTYFEIARRLNRPYSGIVQQINKQRKMQ